LTPAEVFKRIEDVLEQAKTIHLTFRHESETQVTSTVVFGEQSSGSLVLGSGGKLFLLVENSDGVRDQVVCNGSRVWAERHFREKREPVPRFSTPEGLNSGLRKALAHQSVMGIGRAPDVGGTDNPSLGVCSYPSRRISWHIEPTELKEGGEGTKILTLHLKAEPSSQEPFLTEHLYYYPENYRIIKRIVIDPGNKKCGRPAVTVTEIYPEFIIDAEIPDERFNLPSEGK